MLHSKFLLGLAATLLASSLSACGKVGPHSVEVIPQQSFEIVVPSSKTKTISFQTGQKVNVLATYFPSSKKMEIEIGAEKIVFKKTRLNEKQGELNSDPNSSGVRTTSGESLGLFSKSTLRCNPDCERVTRDIRHEQCVYYVTEYEERCQWEDGRYLCRTVLVRRPKQGMHSVEYVLRTKTYDISGSIYGDKQGVLATTSSEVVESEQEVTPRSVCS
jgi:hypothetical protein